MGWVYETLGATFAHYTPNKKAAQYWEAIRISRKAILITTSVFIHDALAQGYVGLFILICCAILCAWTKPFRYQARKYNGMELASLGVLASTAALGKMDEMEQSYLGGMETIKCENPTAASILIVVLNSLLAVALLGSLALEMYRRLWSNTVEQQVAWGNWERFTNKVLIRSTFRSHMGSMIQHDVRRGTVDPHSLSIDFADFAEVKPAPPGPPKQAKHFMGSIEEEEEGMEMADVSGMSTSQNPLLGIADDGLQAFAADTEAAEQAAGPSVSDLPSSSEWPSSPDLPDNMDLPGGMPSAPMPDDMNLPGGMPSAPNLGVRPSAPAVPLALRTSIMEDRKSAVFDARDMAGADDESDGVVAGPVYYRYYDETYQSHYFIDRDTGESTWEAPADDLWSDAPVDLASSSDLASGVDLTSSSDLPDGMDLPGAMPSAPNLSVRKSIMEDRKSPVLQKSPSL